MRIVDIHTHILPGIADGAKDWDTCMKMLEKSWSAGVRKMVATPHFLPWKERQDPLQICRLCEEAQEKAKQELGISMKIVQGNEIYYHQDMIQNIRDGKALTLAGSRYVLVEFPEDISYQELFRGIREILNAHYIPIIAHVERYLCLRKSGRMKEVTEVGALLQMNLEAFQGGLLDDNSRWAKKCLLRQEIHFLASDMHNLDRRPPASKKQLEWAVRKMDRKYLKEVLAVNSEVLF